MGEFSIWHLLIVLVIVLIFFGPNRLPNLGNSLGKAIRGFKDGIKNVENAALDEKTEKKDDEKKS
jgi:sec-independent protein translocase protein TatA